MCFIFQHLISGKRLVNYLICNFALFIGSLNGAIINVDLGGDINAAITSANNGDTIKLAADTYQQEVQVISKSIDIVGAGRDLTIIKAPNATKHLSQKFNFEGVNYWSVLLIDNKDGQTSHTVNIRDLTV